MKPDSHPREERAVTGRVKTSFIAGSMLAALPGVAGPAQAQDDTLPLAANVDQLRVTVGGRQVPVS